MLIRLLSRLLRPAPVAISPAGGVEPRLKLPLDRPRRASGGDSLKIIYRISDGSYPKERFAYATKEACLRNCIAVFKPAAEDMIVIADNVGETTWNMVKALHPNVRRTDIGHGAGSWRYAVFEIALKEFGEGEAVYLLEDDYLHRPGSRQALLEGLALADYVSLYDHSDKYSMTDPADANPLVELGGELTRVIRTANCHWKQTNSTTMTFATTVKLLREDAAVWDKYTRGRHPHDFQAFIELAARPRSLITPIPGYSTHCEAMWASPGIDWEKVTRETT